MVVEIDARLEYRVGFPKLLSLPVSTTRIADMPDALRSHHSNLSKITFAHEIKILRFEFCYRHHKDQQPGGNPVWLLVSDRAYTANSFDTWTHLVQQLSDYICEEEMDLGVEIIDFQAENGMFTAPILSKDRDLLSLWKNERTEAARIMRMHQWLTADFVYRGIREDKMKPTLLISATDADSDHWLVTLEHLQKHMTDVVGIELLYISSYKDIQFADNSNHHEVNNADEAEMSDISAEDSDEADYEAEKKSAQRRGERDMAAHMPKPVIDADAFKQALEIGASVGLQGEDLTGTLGGFFTLKFPTEREKRMEVSPDFRLVSQFQVSSGSQESSIQVGITNHHVLKTKECNGPLRPADISVTSEALKVTSPSDGDRTRCLQLTREMIMELNKSIRNPAQYNFPQAENRRKRISRRQERDVFRGERRQILNLDTLAGSIFARSGGRQRSNPRYSEEEDLEWTNESKHGLEAKEPDREPFKWDVDWALIKINPSRSMNVLTGVVRDFGIRTGMCEIAERGSIEECSNYLVTKVGRTSGWTKGLVSAALSMHNRTASDVSNFPVERLKYNIASFEDENEGRRAPVLVHSIISTGNDDSLFIQPGDSGSLILLNEKRDGDIATVVGIAIGGNSEAKVSYMNPIDLIVHDIEETLGCTVTYPKDRGLVDQNEWL